MAAKRAEKTSKRKRAEKRSDPKRPKRARWVNLVIPPDPFECPMPRNATGDVFIWDLDRTYLRTELDSLRDMIRTAFQKAKDKIAYPGVSALLRALRKGASGTGTSPIYFISASPPQIGKVIAEKFRIESAEQRNLGVGFHTEFLGS